MRADSDVDLVVLTTGPGRCTAKDGLVSELALGELIRNRAWGPVTEWRYVTAPVWRSRSASGPSTGRAPIRSTPARDASSPTGPAPSTTPRGCSRR
ncbi:hypothetical protein ACFYO5_06180 [Streptomyces sp. NPDC006259]|uniref:hypothetical protein n=1 Tax=Streptomyces sp. NPDC006259 TaxID=3364740 RepID=UPI00369D853C